MRTVRGLTLVIMGWCCLPGIAGAEERDRVATLRPVIEGHVQREVASLVAYYKQLHANPELSLQEVQTAASVAKELRGLGITVTEKVGGHGVIGVLKNGAGPVVLVRADLDGLPIVENTGVPYASKVRVKNKDGQEVGVMHACGHDINVTCLVGTARVLAALKDRWRGTLLLVGQPAEEIGAGARMMLADGLFKRFPKPDFALALHCDARYPHGHVNYRIGQMQANVDTVDILVRGKGGHGAAPQNTIDPIVLAAHMVVDLQSIVSREMDPNDPAVITVGSFHGGTKHNIIPGDVKMQLTVRTMSEQSRQKVLAAIARKVKAAAAGARAPEPVIVVDQDQYTPALVNDEALAKRMVPVLKKVLGEERVHERPQSLGGEDFSRFVNDGVPGFYYFLGTVPPEKVTAAAQGGAPLAMTHTDAYSPVPEPTIRTGVLTMSLSVLHLLGEKSE